MKYLAFLLVVLVLAPAAIAQDGLPVIPSGGARHRKRLQWNIVDRFVSPGRRRVTGIA